MPTATEYKLHQFAIDHSLILEKKGEVGFGRPCVGFLSKTGNYLDFNPHKYPDYTDVWEYDERLNAPVGVTEYHKHDCMAVLVGDDDYDKGLDQLALWVDHLEAQGELYVEEFETGADGIQALLSGLTGCAMRIK